MLKFILLCLTTLLLQTPVLAQGLTSVSPIRAEPGTLVTLKGGPFTAQTRILFGTQVLDPVEFSTTEMAFTVPTLTPGDYMLRVNAGGTIGQSYNFEVLEPRPQVTAITPRNTDACLENNQQEVTIEGKGFLPETAVLFNGAVVTKRFDSSERLSFTLRPGLRAGVYGIQLKNPGGAVSLPQSIWVSDIPVIDQIEQGGDYVNHYAMIIRGKNFYFDSILTISEPDSTRHRPLVLQAHDAGLNSSLNSSPPQTDRLVFQDCQTLIYYRYPVDFQDKELRVQVINPDGKKSEPQYLSLP